MRKLLLVMFFGTSFYFSFPAVAIAEVDRPLTDRPQPEQMMQRIRNAQNELQEQRQQLDRERQELERQRDQIQPQRHWPARKQMHKGGHKPLCGLLLVMCLVVHILVAVWVFQDIRMRGAGSGIWIVIALIAGCWERWFTLSYVLVTSKKTDPMTQPGSGEMIVFKPVEKQCRRH